MSNAQFNVGEIRGKTEAKTEQMAQSAKETANTAQEKSTIGKEQTGGFLQQTGEQVKSMGQGAIDGVKSTLGVGDQNKN